jgi:hypothetical protein
MDTTHSSDAAFRVRTFVGYEAWSPLALHCPSTTLRGAQLAARVIRK